MVLCLGGFVGVLPPTYLTERTKLLMVGSVEVLRLGGLVAMAIRTSSVSKIAAVCLVVDVPFCAAFFAGAYTTVRKARGIVYALTDGGALRLCLTPGWCGGGWLGWCGEASICA